MVQRVTNGLDLHSTKLHHWSCSLQTWLLGGNCQREERDTVKVQGVVGWGGTGKGEAKTRFRGQTRGGVHIFKSYRTHLWDSYGNVLQGVGGHSKQAAHQV